MPIVGGQYVAPTWVNGASPAINAAELNAISQTLAACQAPTSHAESSGKHGKGSGTNYGHLKLSDSANTTSGVADGVAATPTAVKSAYSLAQSAKATADSAASAVAAKAPSSTVGTYAGTGGYGVNAKCSIAFANGVFPSAIFITNAASGSSVYQTIILFPKLSVGLSFATDDIGMLRCAVVGSSVQWYSSVGANEQCNLSAQSYRYNAVF